MKNGLPVSVGGAWEIHLSKRSRRSPAS